MPYSPASNTIFDPLVADPSAPEGALYLVGCDLAHSASVTGITVSNSATLPNAPITLDSVRITMDEVLRAAETVPPRDRGTSLNFPVYNYTHYVPESQNVANSIQTVTIPWTDVYQYQYLAASANYGYAQQAQGGSGWLGNIMDGLAGQGAQTASGGQTQVIEMQYGNYGIGQALGGMQQIMNGVTYSYLNAIYAGPPETPKERTARIAKEEERAAKLVVAESRAEQLMFSLLKPEQVKQYVDHGYFETDVNDRVYRIKKGRSMNVELIVKGKPTIRYCAHPRDWTPSPDAMIAQLLMLKTDEQKFIATANRVLLAA
jgi:hypothetical protein